MAEAGNFDTALLARLGCDDVGLRLSRSYSPETSPWHVAAYRFDILVGGEPAGTISLRPGASYLLTHLAGQIGFSVEPAYRGRGLAGKAVKALLPLAKACGLTELWLTTTPDNLASRRTLERLGCSFVEQVTIPESYESYARGERLKLRYRMGLN
ncbi:GNAT family N-acetyltransferase [Bosea sp. BIWAKO-01]|uniref:GNAT family N-acetyltransferase n=1 Tax=Bosea sp. BIWAKO-01 TaxID=506668 RepID=UPI000869C38E|nr:GNAT family N-acetyltransferase [Bosea sp. BIWAKO-01]GAU80591.1 tagatose-bisphosphate aldolase [Bosea sp. BIWAKO-01]